MHESVDVVNEERLIGVVKHLAAENRGGRLTISERIDLDDLGRHDADRFAFLADEIRRVVLAPHDEGEFRANLDEAT